MRSLDAWRQQQGLDKMVLMGHSMGGYLSGTRACYAVPRCGMLHCVGVLLRVYCMQLR